MSQPIRIIARTLLTPAMLAAVALTSQPAGPAGALPARWATPGHGAVVAARWATPGRAAPTGAAAHFV